LLAATRVLKRLALFVVTVWVAATLNFLIPRVGLPIPGLVTVANSADTASRRGPTDRERRFRLNLSLWDQYVGYMGDAVHFDFNYSMASYPNRVSDMIGKALPWTFGLLGVTTVLAWLLGTLLGASIAWPSAPRILRYLLPPMVALSATPFFMVGLILLYVLAFKAQLFPLGGGYEPGTFPALTPEFAANIVSHAMLPALSILVTTIGTFGLGMRGLMVGLQGEDYMLLAQAKGLKGMTVFYNYALRNAWLPQITAIAVTLGQIVSGGLLVEAVFRYPGIGGLLVWSIINHDFFLTQGIVLVIIVSISLATLLLDLIYPLLDPRVSLAH
jgi:peptide/nickel transport system permease protein